MNYRHRIANENFHLIFFHQKLICCATNLNPMTFSLRVFFVFLTSPQFGSITCIFLLHETSFMLKSKWQPENDSGCSEFHFESNKTRRKKMSVNITHRWNQGQENIYVERMIGRNEYRNKNQVRWIGSELVDQPNQTVQSTNRPTDQPTEINNKLTIPQQNQISCRHSQCILFTHIWFFRTSIFLFAFIRVNCFIDTKWLFFDLFSLRFRWVFFAVISIFCFFAIALQNHRFFY